jgi:hypothetical protein
MSSGARLYVCVRKMKPRFLKRGEFLTGLLINYSSILCTLAGHKSREDRDGDVLASERRGRNRVQRPNETEGRLRVLRSGNVQLSGRSVPTCQHWIRRSLQ